MVDADQDSTKKDLLHRTISWLKENYCFVEGVSLSRKTLYENYQSFCRSHVYSPISTATFGKIIRQQFPQITTRRLGTRGNSKYHYHGLAMKKNSVYFNFNEIENFDSYLMTTSPFLNVQHPKNRVDSVPKIQFTIKTIKQSNNVNQLSQEIGNFFIMYQTHSQQIIDSIIHGSFDEILKYLLSFWKTCPEHFKHLFEEPLLIDGIIIIDLQVYIIVYKFVLNSMDDSLPDQYLKEFVHFLNNYSLILSNSITSANKLLREKKIFYALMFKQMCFSWLRGSHLYKIIFPVLSHTDLISEVLEDFQGICIENIIDDTVHAVQGSSIPQMQQLIYEYFERFENLLESDFSFDALLKWIKGIFQSSWENMGMSFKNCFLTWTIFFSKFLQEMFLSLSKCFGQVNLVFLWLEHLFYTESMIQEFEYIIQTLNSIIYSQTSLNYSQCIQLNSMSSPQLPCRTETDIGDNNSQSNENIFQPMEYNEPKVNSEIVSECDALSM